MGVEAREESARHSKDPPVLSPGGVHYGLAKVGCAVSCLRIFANLFFVLFCFMIFLLHSIKFAEIFPQPPSPFASVWRMPLCVYDMGHCMCFLFFTAVRFVATALNAGLAVPLWLKTVFSCCPSQLWVTLVTYSLSSNSVQGVKSAFLESLTVRPVG